MIFERDGVLLDSELVSRAVEAEGFAGDGFPRAAEDIAERFPGRFPAAMPAALERERGRPSPAGFARRPTETTARRFEAEPEIVPEVEAALIEASG